MTKSCVFTDIWNNICSEGIQFLTLIYSFIHHIEHHDPLFHLILTLTRLGSHGSPEKKNQHDMVCIYIAIHIHTHMERGYDREKGREYGILANSLTQLWG